jgi:DNA adenine methylase
MRYKTPLRYPGGKSKLANFIKLLLEKNELHDVHYVEPYAGGAGVALALLYDAYATSIHINDLDRSVYAFWQAILDHTEDFCALILETPVTVGEWERQKLVQDRRDTADLLELGFSTFFLNRTSRSGIIHDSGIIGGKNQTGHWKIDARFNREELAHRVRQVARFKSRIHVHNLDAVVLMKTVLCDLPGNTLIYLDPPYYVKGQELYANAYTHDDHVSIASMVGNLDQHWLVSYDNAPEIRELYREHNSVQYGIFYSAGQAYTGREVMFFSEGLQIPDVANPSKVSSAMVNAKQTPLEFAAD